LYPPSLLARHGAPPTAASALYGVKRSTNHPESRVMCGPELVGRAGLFRVSDLVQTGGDCQVWGPVRRTWTFAQSPRRILRIGRRYDLGGTMLAELRHDRAVHPNNARFLSFSGPEPFESPSDASLPRRSRASTLVRPHAPVDVMYVTQALPQTLVPFPVPTPLSQEEPCLRILPITTPVRMTTCRRIELLTTRPPSLTLRRISNYSDHSQGSNPITGPHIQVSRPPIMETNASTLIVGPYDSSEGPCPFFG
jgi:hypothetical protein